MESLRTIQVDLNVFKTLGLEIKDIHNCRASKAAFIKSLQDAQTQEKQKNIYLAYEILCNTKLKEKLQSNGTAKFILNEDDPNFPLIILILQDFEVIQYCHSKSGNQFFEKKDQLKRSFLYLAVKYNYLDLVKFLLSIGSNVNDPQQDQSTPLHCASYYGLEQSVKLLLLSGSDQSFKNNSKQTPEEEAQNDKIKEIYQKCQKNNFVEMMVKLRSQFPNLKINFVTENEKIKSIYVHNPFTKDSDERIQQDNERFHGTKLGNVISIFSNGLIIPGGKTLDDITIYRPDGHIRSKIKVKGVEDYAKAIFLSKSPFYSSVDVYSETVKIFDENFKVLLHCYPYDQNWIEYSHTLKTYELKPGEDKNVESRIVESEKIFIRGMYLVNQSILQSLKEFNEFWDEFQPERSPFLDTKDDIDYFSYSFSGSKISLTANNDQFLQPRKSLVSRSLKIIKDS